VSVEEPVGGYTDITAQKNGRIVAIEIETGKSDDQANMEKNLGRGFKEILILATGAETYRKICGEVENISADAQVWVEQAQNLIE